jgi:hypothetical protein
MKHGLFSLDLTVVNPQAWDTLPSSDHIRAEIARVLLANRDVADKDTGVDANRVRRVVLTGAASDQISCMWHGHRARSKLGPPQIPLKYFVWWLRTEWKRGFLGRCRNTSWRRRVGGA